MTSIRQTLRVVTASCMAIIIGVVIARAHTLSKYNKWLIPGYFRGFNTSIWSNVIDDVLTQDDFNDLKATGANLAILQTQGLVRDSFPYAPNDPFYIEGIDSLVSYCRNAGLYYVISVRSGPGRRDVWEEGEGLVEPSTIWINETEQQLYAKMLKDFVLRYPGDSLFVGLDMLQEPNPYDNDAYGLPVDVLDSMLTADGIDVNHIYSIFIDSIRTVDPDLPLIVQSVHWSDPEYFSLIELQNDDKVIYNTHCYNPHEYSHADEAYSSTYPGRFWVNTLERDAFWDRDFIRDTILAPVRSFQVSHNVPILLGEFGLQYAQHGGEQYLTDIAEIACDYSWHFTFWSFRTDSTFNYELMGTSYWNTVCNLLAYSPSSIDDKNKSQPVIQTIHVYPNPFDRGTAVEFNLPMGENVKIEIYNIRGQLVKTLMNKRLRGGSHKVIWDGTDSRKRVVSAGVYFVMLKTKSIMKIEKMTLVNR